MNFNLRKILGLILLIIGLGVIFWSIFTSLDIFTAKKEAPEIFKLTETLKPLIIEKNNSQDIESIIERSMQDQLKGILPSGFLPKLLNLISWSIIAGLLIFGGTQISSLGVKLMKE